MPERHIPQLGGVQCEGDREIVDGVLLVDQAVALSRVEAPREGATQLADQAMIRDAKIPQLERKGDEMAKEIGGVGPAVDEHRAVDVRVSDAGEDGGFETDELVVDAADEREATTEAEDRLQRGDVVRANCAVGVGELEELTGRAGDPSGFIFEEGAETYAGHGADADAGVVHAAELYQLRDEHDRNGDALRVAGDHNEVRAADLVDPVEEEFPEEVDAFRNLAFAFEGSGFDAAGVAPRCGIGFD